MQRFGAVTAVDGISLRIRPGEVVALLGPNGAGKTSTVDMLLGLSSPTLLYRWKQNGVRQGGVVAVGLEARVRELEAELRRVERERDILKKALSIFGRDG